MARTGVTEEQVHTAADALTLRGERPTIERVRAELGTGSPNTLIRHLDTWWAQLGGRLSAQHVQVAMPDAPTSVAQAASSMWRLALDHARFLAEHALQADREQLATLQTAVASERETAVQDVHKAQQARDEASARATAAEQRVRDLDHWIGELTAQRNLLSAEHAALVTDHGHLTDRLREANEALVRQAADTLERIKDMETRDRLAENRWLAEVDRARQELRSSNAHAQQALKEARTELDALHGELATAQQAAAAAARAQQASDIGRLALEAEVARLHTALKHNQLSGANAANRRGKDPINSQPPRRLPAKEKQAATKKGSSTRSRASG